MTPSEIVAALDEQSRKLLESRGLPVSDGIVELLNMAGMRGFKLGSDTALSMVKGALAVKLVQLDK